MSKSKIKAFTLLIVTIINGCSGWSIMGYNLDGTNESVFDEVIQDSTVHYYHNLRPGQNWCFNHADYENVELVSE